MLVGTEQVVGWEPVLAPSPVPARALRPGTRSPSRIAVLWRIPADTASWRATALVLALVVAPPLVAFQLMPYSVGLAEQADIIGLFLYPVVLTSAMQLYFHWRLTDDPAAARVAVLLFAAAIQGLSMVMLRIAYADVLRAQVTGFMVIDLMFAVAAVVVVAVPGATARFDPAVIGVALGVVVAAARTGVVLDPYAMTPPPLALHSLDGLLLLLQVAVAVALLRLRPLPGWVRGRLALAFLLLSINRALPYPSLDHTWVSGAAIVTDLLGAVLLCSTSVILLRRTTRRRQHEIQALRERIDEAEDHAQDGRERMHEIGATVAGIACATRLMHEAALLPVDRREQLEHMLDTEIARLQRLMDTRVQDTEDLDLDDIVEPLVGAQHALGRETRWTPSGLQVHGRADDVAEVLHILFENSARHAPGAPVSVTTNHGRDVVRVLVHDQGPGIPAELAGRVFLAGARGRDSRGQGIGLHAAARLSEGMGGSLRLLPAARGTAFLLTIPNARRSHGSGTAAAQ